MVRQPKARRKKKKVISIDDLDKEFSLRIRKRDGKCMRCGATNKPLFCMHYHSRVAMSVRFDDSNAIAGCYSCHLFLEHRKTVEHRNLMIDIFGKQEIDALEKRYVKTKDGGYTQIERQTFLDKWKL